jgi:polysaccharide deacetylase family protein (PEP-CTERM system associated)
MQSGVLNALTVDVEEWFHIVGADELVSSEKLKNCESRVVKNTSRLLDVLGERGCRATFFILGSVAKDYPSLVQKIADEGHEIGTHGLSHRPIYDQTKDEFTKELIESKNILERILNQKVYGHRAASFSVTKETLWAVEAMENAGIEYDSSVFPIRHSRYGIPDSDRFPHRLFDEQGKHSVMEFPLSTIRLLGRNFPMSGGAYFRFLPYPLVRWGIKKLNREDRPAVFYIHPWEIDPGQPRINLPFRRRFVHYHGLRSTERKLKKLLADFRFGPMKEVSPLE